MEKWGCGVIGSRTRFRFWRRKMCEFESHHPHHTCQRDERLRRYICICILQENRMSYQDVVAQIKELLERNLDSFEIANRLCLNLNQIQQIIAIL